jgi:hypothetical protein
MKDPKRFKIPGHGWPAENNSGVVRRPGNRKRGVILKRAEQDMEAFLGKIDGQKTLNLSVLGAGDSLKITTLNTTYTFQMLGPRDAVLSTNRIDRPSGRARLRGCTIGGSSSISPDHIFCGGNLEFLFNATQKIHQTSEITSIFLMSRGRSG